MRRLSSWFSASSPDAVVSLDPSGVTWLSLRPGSCAFGHAVPAGPSPNELADAVVKAHGDAGDRSRQATIALSPAIVAQRFVSLPPLPRAEARGVLLRKAATILSAETNDVIVCARRAADIAAEPGARVEERWIVAATKRAPLRDLLRALQMRRIEAKRVVSVQLSAPAFALELDRSSDEPSIVVALERRHTIISLLASRLLLNQNVLEGGFHDTPTMALTLLQEIKSYDASYRKHSRGGSVTRVLVLGARGERGELLKNSIRAALPNARPELLSDVDAGAKALAHEERAAEAELALACRARESIQADFALRLPARAPVLAAASCATFALASVAGTISYHHFHTDELDVLERARTVHARAIDLEDLQARLLIVRAKLDELAALAQRNAGALHGGWPLEEALAAVFGAAASNAAVIGLTLGRIDADAEVEIDAQTSPQPFAAMQHVERVREALSQSGLFESVEANPESTPGIGSKPFTFSVRARAVRP